MQAKEFVGTNAIARWWLRVFPIMVPILYGKVAWGQPESYVKSKKLQRLSYSPRVSRKQETGGAISTFSGVENKRVGGPTFCTPQRKRGAVIGRSTI